MFAVTDKESDNTVKEEEQEAPTELSAASVEDKNEVETPATNSESAMLVLTLTF